MGVKLTQQNEDIKGKPLVSVIIPTFNSSSAIDTCIKSVISQTHDNTEIIVVDSGSVDDTKNIVRKYEKVKFFNIGSERSRTYARNYGVKNAKGKYLIFLDSDIELSPKVIEECIEKTRENFEVVTFPEAIVGEGFWAACRALEAKCYLGDDLIEAPRFFSRHTFNEVGGFDENMTAGEDWDLRERVLQRGYKIARIKAMTMHHEGKVNPIMRIKKKYDYGRTLDKYMGKYKGNTRKQIPLLRSCYYRNRRILIKDPAHTIGFFLLKMLETLATGLGLIRNKFGNNTHLNKESYV